MKLGYYKWHSINLLPHGGYHTVLYGGAHNGTPDVQETYGRCYWATVFGVVLTLDIMNAPKGRSWCSNAIGPAWSRRHGQWYWLDDVLDFM